jgi:hypothetical protein
VILPSVQQVVEGLSVVVITPLLCLGPDRLCAEVR